MYTLMSRVGWFSIFATTIQVMLLLFFMGFVRYDDLYDAVTTNANTTRLPDDASATNLRQVYPMLQDVQVMALVGFGFLMTFLRRYGHSSLGLTLLLASFALQVSLLLDGASKAASNGIVTLGLSSLVNSTFAGVAMLISVGAVLGRTSPTQLLFMTLAEVPVYILNTHVCLNVMGAVDHGGSIVIHVFGAFFGLGFSKSVTRSQATPLRQHPKATSSYTSDMFSMIGTYFLWAYWPSFNAVEVAGARGQGRAVINTYLALAGSTFSTFVISSWVHRS